MPRRETSEEIYEMKTLTNNQSKVEVVLDDDEGCTKEAQHHQDSSHYEHNKIHHLDDKEAIRQELLGKVCFSSSATEQKQNKKKGSSSSRVVGEGREVIEHQHDNNEPHHDNVAKDVTRHSRVCRSKHSQRRAAKWRLQQA